MLKNMAFALKKDEGILSIEKPLYILYLILTKYSPLASYHLTTSSGSKSRLVAITLYPL